MQIQGVAAAPGIAIGPVFQFRQAELRVTQRTGTEPAAEWQRLSAALQEAGAQIQAVRAKAEAEAGGNEAAIFEAQALMLEDPELIETCQQAIQEQHLNAEAAVQQATENYAAGLEALTDEYFRARAVDVRDIGRRVLSILMGQTDMPSADLHQPSIIAARDLTPSDTIQLDKSMVLGLCTAEGGVTSHTAILARSLGLPAVVGLGQQLLQIPDCTPAILDGTQGCIITEPTPEVLDQYYRQKGRDAQARARAQRTCREPAITRDGRRVEVVANIGSVEGARTALDNGAEGVGLLRTEFLYLERQDLPGEEEQYEAYRAILDRFGDLPVVLRTLDIGGDKELPYLRQAAELNPFLGVRGLRLCLANPQLFKTQLRAALRAGVDRNLKIMFPMVSTVGEVRAARQMVQDCQAELRTEGIPTAQRLELGIMVEVPSAALMADQLARHVDFFSIGTNDLTQYTLAADRTNAELAHLSSALSPAVLRLIGQVISAAHRQGKWVGLCGELAGDPLGIPVLLGLGLDEFSMNPPAIPLAKELLRGLTVENTQSLAEAALACESSEQVQDLTRGI